MLRNEKPGSIDTFKIKVGYMYGQRNGMGSKVRLVQKYVQSHECFKTACRAVPSQRLNWITTRQIASLAPFITHITSVCHVWPCGRGGLGRRKMALDLLDL